jgi:hypothetical protein
MSLMNVLVSLPSQTAQDFKDICNLAPGSNQAVRNLANLFNRINIGESYGTITVNSGSVQAAATMTVSAGGSGDGETCVVAGVTFTAKSSGASGNQFNVSATAATQASNMAAAFNASTDLAGIVTAAAVGAVVTITAVLPGVMGNGLVASDALANVATVSFAGGTNGTQYVLDLS